MDYQMTIRVECYAGSSYPEHPRAFVWEDQRYTVHKILDRRREPPGVGFTVCCTPGETVFDLFYLIEEEKWQICLKSLAIINKSTRSKPNFQGD